MAGQINTHLILIGALSCCQCRCTCYLALHQYLITLHTASLMLQMKSQSFLPCIPLPWAQCMNECSQRFRQLVGTSQHCHSCCSCLWMQHKTLPDTASVMLQMMMWQSLPHCSPFPGRFWQLGGGRKPAWRTRESWPSTQTLSARSIRMSSHRRTSSWPRSCCMYVRIMAGCTSRPRRLSPPFRPYQRSTASEWLHCAVKNRTRPHGHASA